MKPLADCRLYTFVDTAYLQGRSAEFVAQQLCDGGSDLIQLRAKHSSPAEIRELALKILPVTRRAGIGLVINDYLEIAEEVGAEYCHLGQEDFFGGGHERISEIRGPQSRMGIGLSTHAPEQAQRALTSGADYIAIGPVYPTGTKPDAKPVTLEYVRWAAAHAPVPWFAIGGINLQTVDAVMEAGARRICVVSAILNATDIAQACAQFRERLN